jgi:antitoxin component of MazEF toxin-antitoxin module
MKKSASSLRVTVPSFIVKTLHLEAGDELEWEIESIESGSVRIRIVKNKNIENKE